MGLAKYHEDDLKILENYHHFKEMDPYFSSQTQCLADKFQCPYCGKRFSRRNELTTHLVKNHSRDYLWINGSYKRSKNIDLNPESDVVWFHHIGCNEKVRLEIKGDKSYSLSLQSEDRVSKVNLTPYFRQKPFRKAILKTAYGQFVFYNRTLDIKTVSNADILNGRFSTHLFNNLYQNEELDESGLLTFLKMMIHEHKPNITDVATFGVSRFKDDNQTVHDIYLYENLALKEYRFKTNTLSKEGFLSLKALLELDPCQFDKEYSQVTETREKSCLQLIHALLYGENNHVEFEIDQFKENSDWTGNPFLKSLLHLLVQLHECDFERSDFWQKYRDSILEDLAEISLFKNYSLIQSLSDLDKHLKNSSFLPEEIYRPIQNISPVCCWAFVQNQSQQVMNDELAQMAPRFSDKIVLAKLAYENNLPCRFMYQKPEETGKFSSEFIRSFRPDENIQLTNLADSSGYCLAIFYRGTSLLVNCGWSPSYFKNFSSDIDYVFLTDSGLEKISGLLKTSDYWKSVRLISTRRVVNLLEESLLDGDLEDSELIRRYSIFDHLWIAEEDEWVWLDKDRAISFKFVNNETSDSCRLILRLKDKILTFTDPENRFNENKTDFLYFHQPEHLEISDLMISLKNYGPDVLLIDEHQVSPEKISAAFENDLILLDQNTENDRIFSQRKLKE